MYALLGKTLKHSISPVIHRKIMQKMGVQAEYELLEVAEEELEGTLKSGLYKGFNVTIPYKEKVCAYLDGLADSAKAIGAVNTIEYAQGLKIGHNTDYQGFADMLSHAGIDVTGQLVTVLGTGGAAKTVLNYLGKVQAGQVYVVSRTQETKNMLGAQMLHYEQLDCLNSVGILINTTPNGMYPNIDSCPVSRAVVAKSTAVVDLIYNPARTVLLQHASSCGLKAVNGLHMLVAQAVYAQAIWQQRSVDQGIIQSIVDELVKKYE